MFTASRFSNRLIAVAATIVFLTAFTFAPSVSAGSQRSGTLHVVKTCAGTFPIVCTVQSSNMKAIPVGSTITYATPVGVPVPGWLSSNVVLDTRAGSTAFGHCDLNLGGTGGTFGVGTCTFSGGTGSLRNFQAYVAVSTSDGGHSWNLDGPYHFSS